MEKGENVHTHTKGKVYIQNIDCAHNRTLKSYLWFKWLWNISFQTSEKGSLLDSGIAYYAHGGMLYKFCKT